MPPSATLGASGDYELTGTLRASCSAVVVEAHTLLSPERTFRFAPPEPSGNAQVTLRFAASDKGKVIPYSVTVYAANGNESSPPLDESVSLE